ncbi:inositol monophosphatase family protein [Salipiger mangrovisoli]|uniref:3'(2'),5'-bisphosphate nucleotidase CysQ n=1 Tax=Salipiger mangrovisoli TaxID=2865933 RepID=A0ABR9X2Y0_9RHOB|nr:3'(2'),5'-bisphosphate nucleotidase CysQ [Salipiger mangrovisoli]MBE9637874.1 3'(2'),5'-bisphosphate nucleotidase CysQ [Salipiger mangrovisoli]
MPESDRALLEHAAREAGAVALSFAGGGLDVRYKAADGSPVTAADLAVNARLEALLRGARADYGWLSEESVDSDTRRAAEKVFIIDPIDGTRSFIAGEDTWAHSLAVAENGVVTAAAVYLPKRDLLYSAALGQGAVLNGVPIRATATPTLEEAEVLAPRPVVDAPYWRVPLPPIRRAHRPSLAYRLGLVAEGRFDAMLTFRPTWEWDIAAGTLLLQEAGATVTDRLGRPLRFNARHPQHPGVVAANPALHRDIMGRLTLAP